MSEWGYVDYDTTFRRLEHNDVKGVCETVSAMSRAILDHEAAISRLKDELLAAERRNVALQAEASRLQGYIDRVRETDRAAEHHHAGGGRRHGRVHIAKGRPR